MKTSTDGTTRLMAAVLQQQLAEAGIALDIRSFEAATFLADVAKGAFQFYSLRWIGGNQDPDMFEAAFHSSRVPPNGVNRGHYSNPRVDALIEEGRRTQDQARRKAIYAELQTILATDHLGRDEHRRQGDETGSPFQFERRHRSDGHERQPRERARGDQPAQRKAE